MAVVKARTEDFEKVGNFLRLRVGLVFPAGKEPKNAPFMIRHPAPVGAKWSKIYFQQKGLDLVEAVEIEYPVSEPMTHASFGELLLKKTKRPVLFGRFGEEKPFTFKEKTSFEEGTSYIPLRINRPGEAEFITLYMRTEDDDGNPSCFALMVRWDDGSISVGIYPVDVEREEVPAFLFEAK
ncbi:MAG: hypothetical protein HYS15_02250 [Candidatus Spechtbacteria bacterium]|nr:hypothetical protein [Candidatus Spechtbacteria bacterium]